MLPVFLKYQSFRLAEPRLHLGYLTFVLTHYPYVGYRIKYNVVTSWLQKELSNYKLL